RILKMRFYNRVNTQATTFRRFSNLTQTVGRELEPTTCERLHFRRDVKIFTEYCFQSLRVARLAGEPSRKEKLGRVRHGIPFLQCLHANSKARADVNRVSLIFWTVEVGNFLVRSPDAIKQAQQPIMKDVQESGNRLIPMMHLTLQR